MLVKKRNNELAEFDFEKIVKVVRFANDNEEDIQLFLNDLKLNLKNNMTTREIQRTLVQLAVEKTTVHSTRWDSMAARLYLYNLIKEASINRGYEGCQYGDFYSLIVHLTNSNFYHKDILVN